MEVALPPAIEPTGPRIELDLSSEEGSDDSASIDCSSTDSDDEDEDDDGTLQPEPEPEPEPQPQARGGAAGRRGLQRSARKAMLESLPSSRQLLESQLTPPSIGAEPAPQPESPMAPVAPVTPPALAQVAEAPEGGAYAHCQALLTLEEGEARTEEEASAGMRALHAAGRFTVGPRGLPLTLRMEHTDWSGRGLCRLTLSSALPGGFEVADGAALARLGLGEGAEATLLDISWPPSDLARSDTATDALWGGGGAGGLLALAGVGAAEYAQHPSETLAARRAAATAGAPPPLSLSAAQQAAQAAEQLEEEGQWLLLELVGAMGEALQAAHGEAAGSAVSWPLEGVPLAELFGPDAVSC